MNFGSAGWIVWALVQGHLENHRFKFTTVPFIFYCTSLLCYSIKHPTKTGKIKRKSQPPLKTIDYSFKDLYSKIRALQLLNLTKGSYITALDPFVFYSAFILC